jgi:hypothetical protein
VAPPEAADLALHTALLVGTVDAGAAEERVEPIVAAQRGEPFGLGAITTLEDPDDGGFEVVVPDPAGHTAEVLEGQHVTLQERFLGLSGERDVKRFARVRQSHHEHPALHDQSGDHGVELAEVDLGLGTGQMRLRNRHLMGQQPELHPTTRDVTRHRHLREGRLVLGNQPLPDPPCGMALLAWGVLVGDEPGVNHRHPPVDRRAGPRRIHLPRRRDRVIERLAHRPTMHPMTIRQLTDRHVIEPSVSPDLLEQFHA